MVKRSEARPHKTRRLCLPIVMLILLVSTLATPAFSTQEAEADAAGNPWVESLEAISQTLQEGQWADAKAAADKLLATMTHSMLKADGAARYFALASLYRALAHAGLGEEREARWDWHIVFELDPKLAKRAGLEPFGSAGQFLADYRRDPEALETASLYADSPIRVGTAGGEGGLSRPQIIDGAQPAMPQSLENKNVPYRVSGRIMIGADGRPLRATVDTSPGSVFTFAVLNAAKAWTFTPAVLDGHRIKMPSPFTVDFSRQATAPPPS